MAVGRAVARGQQSVAGPAARDDGVPSLRGAGLPRRLSCRGVRKRSATGIVRHLDDQCIGCQYCILKCPYDVPKYSRSKGIVRKCDMCSQRLAVGEAPACVQACPNGAIRITSLVKRRSRKTPKPIRSCPALPNRAIRCRRRSTRLRKPLPANLLPADYYSAAPQHAHWPLVLMLVLTQMSVGAFVVDY